MTRGISVASWAALALALAFLVLPSVAAANESVASTGPIENLTVGDDLSCQVSYIQGGTFEFYPPDTSPGDCGTFVSVDGTLYAPNFALHPRTATSFGNWPSLTPRSESMTGSGTSADPYAITTNAEAGSTGISLEQRMTYVVGQSSFRVDVTARNSSNAARAISVYWAGDCYASGSDIGYGFVRPEIKSVGCSQTSDNNPPARTIQLLPLSPGSTGVEDRYHSVWDRIDSQQIFDNSCLCSDNVDNGVGLMWSTALPDGSTRTFSLQVALTEQQPSAPPIDTDGDSLPDSWETGQGQVADAENLAPLGADPNRRDIFVHADWMSGCKPPVGWEKPAIDMFATQGIALHVDSGADSINANGQPWGTASRAGEVPYQDVLDLHNWQQVDADKDAHFLPSGRRRAFHYVLFANQATIGGAPDSMGLSRGIPDSDFVIANCHASPRSDAEYFVHELGHNLGLRHGGNEDKNNKTPYFSAMNYGWALWAISKGRPFIPYSDRVLPPIDENNIDEHGGINEPAEYFCPGDRSPSQHFIGHGVLTDWDFDCDGHFGERHVKANLDGSQQLDTLAGFNDWQAIRFSGGGVVGALTLPARQDAVPVSELTGAEVQQAAAAEQAGAVAAAKQLMILVNVHEIHKSRRHKAKNTIKLRVTTMSGRPVGHAGIRILGGKLAKGRKQRYTDRHGRIALTLSLGSAGQLQLISSHRGYRPATLVIPVLKAKVHPIKKHRIKRKKTRGLAALAQVPS
jgi:hypothetical protein